VVSLGLQVYVQLGGLSRRHDQAGRYLGTLQLGPGRVHPDAVDVVGIERFRPLSER
jgi:hypothetical protein